MPRFIVKLGYRLRDVIDYLRAFRSHEGGNLKVAEANDDDFLVAAKKLHAKVYLERGFVRARDVVEGILTEKADPHQFHSKYFAVINTKNSQMVATARQIEVRPGRGYNSFAMIKKANLYKRARKLIRKHSPDKSIEISGLAKEYGVSKMAPLLLYRAMWHRSLNEGHTLWMLACDVRLFVRLKLLFGQSILKMGRVTHYYGGDVVPAVLIVDSSIAALKKSLDNAPFFEKPLRRRVIRFMLNGVPVDKLNKKERRFYDEIRHLR